MMIAAEAAGKKAGRIRMIRVADASQASLLPAIVQSVEPGTMIHTDGWRAYGGLNDLGCGHKAIRRDGQNLLPKINLTVSLLKRSLHGTRSS